MESANPAFMVAQYPAVLERNGVALDDRGVRMRETLTGFFSLSCAIWPELLEALADDGPVMLMNVVHDASMPRS